MSAQGCGAGGSRCATGLDTHVSLYVHPQGFAVNMSLPPAAALLGAITDCDETAPPAVRRLLQAGFCFGQAEIGTHFAQRV